MGTYLDSSDFSLASSQRDPTRARVRLRAVLICDVVDSTAILGTLGDRVATDLLRKHDRMARDQIHQKRGQEIDKSDGFLVLFAQPADAVGFALAYLRELKALAEDAKQHMQARVGIHYGEVLVYENTRDDVEQGAKPMEVEGIAKSIAARLMGAAEPNQILLTRGPFELARRELEADNTQATLRWLKHGRYQIKGLPEALEVFEVGEPKIAPLRAPSGSSKVSALRHPSRRWLLGLVLLLAAAVALAVAYAR